MLTHEQVIRAFKRLEKGWPDDLFIWVQADGGNISLMQKKDGKRDMDVHGDVRPECRSKFMVCPICLIPVHTTKSGMVFRHGHRRHCRNKNYSGFIVGASFEEIKPPCSGSGMIARNLNDEESENRRLRFFKLKAEGR